MTDRGAGSPVEPLLVDDGGHGAGNEVAVGSSPANTISDVAAGDGDERRLNEAELGRQAGDLGFESGQVGLGPRPAHHAERLALRQELARSVPRGEITERIGPDQVDKAHARSALGPPGLPTT